MDLRTIGVIGAGQMGGGIAHVCALSGFEVRLLDLEESQLAEAMEKIERDMHRQAARGKVGDTDVGAALARISTSTDYAVFSDCDLVVEAATEDESIKREILKTLVPHLSADAIIATNTSSISITRLAAVTDRPMICIG